MSKNNDLVTIIIPVYNGDNYLEKAIDSALNQTYQNIEILVVNDGSTDDGKTRDIAKKYGDKIVYCEKENGGVASALNYGIKKAKGKFVSWLSHDDEYDKDKIAEEIKAISSEDEIVICNVTTIDLNSEVMENYHIPEMMNLSVKTFLAANPYIGLNGCAMLIPKSIFKKYGYFNEKLRYTQDYDLWFRFAEAGVKFKLVEKNLMLSRQHSEQDSRKFNLQCTLDADTLHADFLQKIDCEEFFNAFKSIEQIEEYFNVYLANKYVKTSAWIMKVLTDYLLKNNRIDDYKKVVAKNIYYTNDYDSVIVPNNLNNNIMFYSNAWTKGGIERVLSLIMPGLSNNYTVYLANLKTINDDAYYLDSNINHIVIGEDDKPAEEKIDYISLALCLLYNIKIYVGNPNIIEKFLDTYPLLKEFNIRTVAINHYYYFLPLQIEWCYPIIKKRNEILDQVDVAIWLTTYSLSAYNCLHDNGLKIGNPAAFEIQKPCKNKNRDTIICVGRFYDTIKRIDRIFKIFKKVLEAKPSAKLWLVGDYNWDFKNAITDNMTLKDYYNSFNFPEGSVKFWGRQEKMEDFYSKADVFLLTSESEGFSLSTLEAITCGLPCVSGKINGLNELIENNQNALIEEQDDYDALARDIVRILKDKNLIESFEKVSYSKAKKFTKEEIVRKYQELFEVLLTDNYQENLKKLINKEYVQYDNYVDIVKEYEKYIPQIISNVDAKKEVLKKEIANLSNDIQAQVDVIVNYDKQLTEMTAMYNELLAKENAKKVEYIREEYPIFKEIKYLIKRILRGIKNRVKKLFRK